MKLKTHLPILILALTAISPLLQVQAEEPSLPQELRGTIGTILGNAINGVTVFSSQSSVSGGTFWIDTPDAPDTKIEIHRIPFSYDLTKDTCTTPFIEGNISHMRVTEEIPPAEGEGANDLSRLETLSAGFGTGIKLRATEEFMIIPSVGAYYSHTRNYYDYNNPFSQEVMLPYGKQLFNWDAETITYTPKIKVQYELDIRETMVTLWSSYTHLFNKSLSSNSPTIDVHTDTGLWQNGLSLTKPLDASLDEIPLALRTTLTRTDIYRSGRQGLEFGYFFETGIDLVGDTDKKSDIFSEIALGTSFSWGADVTGWRLSLGLAF